MEEGQENQGNLKEQEQYVTKDMLLMDIITQYPEVSPILMGYGLHCVGCHLSGVDTLESGTKIHGMDEETLSLMLKDINTIIQKFKEDSD